MKRTLIVLLVGVFAGILLLPPSITFAGCQNEKPATERSEMLTANVLVLDPDGNPVEGAMVYCTGLRSKVEPGSHWGWDDEYGPLPKIQTNAEGIAAMPYPKYLTEKIETGTMTWTVEHPEFVDFREDRSVSDDPAEIRLKRGFKIAVTAVDGESGEVIKTDLYALVSGSSWTKTWKLADNGTLISPVFDHKQSVMRVMRIVKGEPILFSELIPIDSEGKSRVLLRDVKLSKGVRVEGRLADEVSRPVQNGFVTIRLTNQTVPGDRNGLWCWSDSVPIAEDGRFVFVSLPDGILQMAPICDDWVPLNPTKDEVLQFFPLEAAAGAGKSFPQLLRAEVGVVACPVLKMEQATSCEITVLDPDGNPLAGAQVWMGPNQYWFSMGSQILGTSIRTAELLVKASKGDFEWNRDHRYSAKTDVNGFARIANLPPGGIGGISAEHKDFELPVAGGRRRTSVDLKPGEVAKITIQMEKKGTEVLGAGEAEEKDKSDEDGGKGDGDGGRMDN